MYLQRELSQKEVEKITCNANNAKLGSVRLFKKQRFKYIISLLQEFYAEF